MGLGAGHVTCFGTRWPLPHTQRAGDEQCGNTITRGGNTNLSGLLQSATAERRETRSVLIHGGAILGAREPIARTCARALPTSVGSESRSSHNLHYGRRFAKLRFCRGVLRSASHTHNLIARLWLARGDDRGRIRLGSMRVPRGSLQRGQRQRRGAAFRASFSEELGACSALE